MAGWNRITLIGNLVRDPSLKTLPSNVEVCECCIAVNSRREREETMFLDFALFGKRAKTFHDYAAKGRQVMIEGRLCYRTWVGKDQQKRSAYSVEADGFELLGRKDDDRAPAPLPIEIPDAGEDRPPPRPEDIPF